MVMGWRWLILLLWCFSTTDTDRVHAQLPRTRGFISIDCGIPADHDYTDSITNIPYTSDSGFIDSGDNYNVTSLTPQESTLRSFANGPQRNCYTIKPVQNDLKYLVRATFMYGNYDGNNTTSAKPIVFNLHIGVNFWTTINIVNASVVYSAEALIALTGAFIWVCLVDIGSGTPFISSLEVRPLEKTIYNAVNATNPLGLLARVDMGSAGKAVRYPDDLYDRIWAPDSDSISYPNIPGEWQAISTKSTISYNDSDTFRVPSTVMQTAVIRPVKDDDWLNFSWIGGRDGNSADYKYYMNIHFTEIDEDALKPPLRKLNVYVNDVLWLNNYSPPYLLPGYQCRTSPFNQSHEYRVSIRESYDSDAGLPPIMSALEVYYVINLPELGTDDNDVDALMSVKNQYQVKKNWMGDPCAPQNYTWDGVNCNNYSNSGTPRVISLNMSSSGLTGEIPSSLEKLTAITSLDLSNNSLEGEIPDFLAALPSLQLLNLTGNQLSGSIPPALWSKSVDGSLTLSTEGNPNLCTEGGSCAKKKKKSSVLIIVIAFASVLSVLILVVFILWRIWTGKQGLASFIAVKTPNEEDMGEELHRDDHVIQCEGRVFTYEDLKKITRNFHRDIGRGDFGTVYHGSLANGRQVAVKLLSQSSRQGTEEFLSEVRLLTRIHHRNLVTLVGYCKDRNNLALVYEYMDQGSLREHLRDKHSKSSVLNWDKRIRIALDAAQGLEYLHKGCSPPIIHGDVKTANILLGQKFDAKLADFGLSKAFINDEDTHVSTNVRGTYGYLDPAFRRTQQLNEKSDVYSFGVVLLELVTGQPALLQVGSEMVPIIKWVQNPRLESEEISDVADSKLQGDYDINSILNVVNIAMKCTSEASIHRPMMTDVVIQLKESLALEAARVSSERPLEAARVSPFRIEHSGPRSLDTVPSAR